MVDWNEPPARNMLAGGALAVASILVPYLVLIPDPGATIPLSLYFEGANLQTGEPIWVVLVPVVVSIVAFTPLLAWRADMVDDEAMLDWFPFGRHVEFNFAVLLAGSILFVSLPLSTDLVLAVTAGVLPATLSMGLVIAAAHFVPPTVASGLCFYLWIVPYQETVGAA